jgi:hypothetical protein
MVTSIIDNFCDLMRNTKFPNTTEKIFFSELLRTVSRDRDNGLDIDLDGFLEQIVVVFKQLEDDIWELEHLDIMDIYRYLYISIDIHAILRY